MIENKKELCEFLSNNYKMNEKNIHKLFCKYNIDYFNFIKDEKSSTECNIIEINNVVYFMFKGTENNFIDISYNLIYFPKKIKKSIYCHRGYLKKFLSICKQLLKEFIKHENKRIVIMGDSMGGALARICYFYIKEYEILNMNNVDLFTICTPVMSNRKFNEVVADKNNYINTADIINIIPYWLFGYSKPITIYIKDTGFCSVEKHSTDYYVSIIEKD